VSKLKIYPRHSVNLDIREFFLALKEIFWPQKKTILQFEKKFAQTLGSKYALTIPSCRYGIYQYLCMLSLNENDQVIMPAFSFEALPFCISSAGASPRFVDLSSQTFNLEAHQVLSEIGPNTKAVLVSHLFGKHSSVIKIASELKQRNIKLIEDCAHALGSQYQEQFLGTFGDIGLFSFGPGKSLNTCGGGMMVTNSEETYQYFLNKRNDLPSADRISEWKNLCSNMCQGLLTTGLVYKLVTFQLIKLMSRFNINYFDELVNEKVTSQSFTSSLKKTKLYSSYQARLGIIKLENLQKHMDKLKEQTRFFDHYFKTNQLITEQLEFKNGEYPSYYVLMGKNRDSIRQTLLKKGIDTKACDMSNCATIFNAQNKNLFPITDKIVSGSFEVPLATHFEHDDLEYIASNITRIVKETN
jgi:dTDP-4-amino-4,6-dideoxygalactose transaminase